jgi:hypothetical protein
MQLLYSGKDTTERFIGSQLISNVNYDLNNHLGFTLETGWFNTGSFLKEVGSGKDYFYAALTAQFKF